MTHSANDNSLGGRGPAPGVDFDLDPQGAGGAFDWAEELMARPRRFAPSSRFYGQDRLAAALWWAARRHARPERFLGWEDELIVDMRPRLDAEGRPYLSGAQLNQFVDHLTTRARGELRNLVYLRPRPERAAASMLKAAMNAIGRRGRDVPREG